MDINIQNKLEALENEYTKNLPNKIHSLEEKWQKLSKHWTVEGVREFHRAVHGLCGSAGTYGYHELSAAMRVLEIYLKSFLDKTEINVDESQKMTELMKTVSKTFLVSTQHSLMSISPQELKISKPNKRVYILDRDKKFVDEIQKNLDAMDYESTAFSDVTAFNEAIQTKPPGMIVVDVNDLDENEIVILQKSHQEDNPMLLFCTASQGDLRSRLKAIRNGAAAFFVKTDEPFYLTKKLDQLSSSSSNVPLRILIVDDSLSLAEYYSIILEAAGMEVRYITEPLRMLDVLNDFLPDLLLLDVYMPECSGLELAAVLRQESIYAGIPIIFLSIEDDRLKQLAALNLGGDDFLTKPILPQHLIAAVRSRAKRAGVLSSYMTRDSLTGLLNHTNILKHLEIELSRANRLHSKLCFIMLDIDHFKSVNDTYGHLMGDHVLRILSELLLRRLRKTDWVGRYGGEEFAVILPNTSMDTAVALCKQIRELFAEHVFRAEDAQDFNVTISAGIALYPEFNDKKSLIEAADRALYQAKYQGRNQEVLIKK